MAKTAKKTTANKEVAETTTVDKVVTETIIEDKAIGSKKDLAVCPSPEDKPKAKPIDEKKLVEAAKAMNESNTAVFNEKKKKSLFPSDAKEPDHILKIASILKVSADIRLFVSKEIVKHLIEVKQLKGKAFVDFQRNKFTVSYRHIKRDYEYTEIFFLNALADGFTAYGQMVQQAIDDVIAIEKI